MSALEVLALLRERGVELWVDGEQLRYKGSEEVMTPELIDEMRSNKQELVNLLHNEKNNGSKEIQLSRSGSARAKLGNSFVGNSGLKVSELALGPYSSTMVDSGSDDIFIALLDTYSEAGGNYIDLSNVYTKSEERVGRWLESRNRHDFVLSSKVGLKVGEGPNDMGLSRRHILMSLDKSLHDLGTDYIDIYYCHAWDSATPLEETLSALTDVVKAGKVRYLGLSNFTGWQLQKSIDIAKYTLKEPFICLQTQYNLLDRYPEWEQLPVCREEGLGVFAWGSLAAGWLTGRYRRGMVSTAVGKRAAFESAIGFHHNSFEFRNNERTWNTIDTLLEVSEALGKTPAQVSLNWLLGRARSGGVIPILGSRNVEQLKEGLGAAGWALPHEFRSRLDEASSLPPVMPHVFVDAAVKHGWLR